MPTRVNPGQQLIAGETVNQLIDGSFLSVSGITATAGGGQANAIQLNARYVQVDTVASVADSVKLPPAIPNPTGAGIVEVAIYNNGASNMAVFPASGDQILNNAVNASVTVNANAVAIFFCAKKGTWAQK
jgi:hypothetical protein